MSNYFDNNMVEYAILEYMNYCSKDERECKNAVSLNRFICKELQKLIEAVMNSFKLHGKNDDDLKQEALCVCLENLGSFDPVKGKAHSFFTLIIKRSLQKNVDWNEKDNDIDDIDICINLDISNFCVKSFIYAIYSICSDGNEKSLTDLLEQYLIKSIGKYNRREFTRFAKSYGWYPHIIRKYINNIHESKDKIKEFLEGV